MLLKKKMRKKKKMSTKKKLLKLTNQNLERKDMNLNMEQRPLLMLKMKFNLQVKREKTKLLRKMERVVQRK